MKLLSSILLIIFLSVSAKSFSQIKSVDINALTSMMEGTFSSEEQSRNDSDFYDLTIHAKKIWPLRTDGKWLYIEEAHSDSPDNPQRQIVRCINTAYEGRFKSTDYSLNDPERFVGEWIKENPLSDLTPDSLEIIEGCSMIYTLMTSDTFEGNTEGNGCPCKKGKTKYVRSEVTITKDEIARRDKGFDENGKQLWGAKVAYVFKRIKN